MSFLSSKRQKKQRADYQARTSEKSPFSHFYYREIAQLTASGGWSVNFKEKKSYLDPEARRILRTPAGYRATLKNALDFYHPDSREKATNMFMECSLGKPFSTEIKMLTFNKKEFWAKAVGRPIIAPNKEILGIQGVFQDITEQRSREEKLQKSLKTIESQNSQLFNFANVVSHNLRSHVSNLHLTLDLLKSSTDTKEKKELNKNLYKISKSLNYTIEHLNEIVNAQSRSLDKPEKIRFEEILKKVKRKLNEKIQESEAQIYSDFSEVSQIEYIPSYLESIMDNLISNAIKYSRPKTTPIIDICAYLENGETVLMVKDNGLGMDLDQYGTRLFQMYQTFHQNEEAIGIGLFIMKNQIEALQGTVTVESEPDVGTTFRIRF